MRRRKLAIIGILTVVFALLVYFTPDSPVLYSIKNILGLFLLMVFPGYLLVDLLFGGKLDTIETSVLTIGLSISIVIMLAMATYFAGLQIDVFTILNVIIVATFVLIFAGFLKRPERRGGRLESERRDVGRKDMERIARRSRSIDRSMYSHILLIVVVLVLLSFLSATLPPKDQFVELYWSTAEVENLKEVEASGVQCMRKDCGLSDVRKIGQVTFADDVFDIMVTDLGEIGKYDTFCIDLNRNGKFCDVYEDEGPYRYYETFFIGPRAFTSLRFDESKIAFVNYPEYIFSENFTTSFSARSMYSKKMTFDIKVTVNGSLQYSEFIELEPKQEIAREVGISIPSRGYYKVEAEIKPTVTGSEGARIHFWVDRRM